MILTLLEDLGRFRTKFPSNFEEIIIMHCLNLPLVISQSLQPATRYRLINTQVVPVI